MFRTMSVTEKKIDNRSYLVINLLFAFFPISLLLGSFLVNLNLLLFCCLGIFYLRSNILKSEIDLPIKIIFLFFVIVVFSTSLNLARSLYFQGFESINIVPYCYSTNCYSPLAKLIKSILFLRFFLFLLIVYLANKYDILNFKYFFLSAALTTIVLCLDIIFQYIFGFDILGMKPSDFYHSGFFGDEFIAGGFIQRFSFFSLFFIFVLNKNKNYIKYISIISLVCILAAGLLFAGNRIPLVLFIIGLFLIFFINIKIKKILFLSFISMFLLLKLIMWSDEPYKNFIKDSYWSFFNQSRTLMDTGVRFWNKTERWNWKGWEKTEKPKISNEEFYGQKTNFYVAEYESMHKRIFLSAIETWKYNKIFGNGFKSFRDVCWKLDENPKINLSEDLWPNKKNLLCSNHPHNYYLEILTETGILGIAVILIIAIMFLTSIFKNFRSIKLTFVENFIFLSATLSLILETMPIRSTGSIFTTNNAAFLILISSIILCHKKLMKNIKEK